MIDRFGRTIDYLRVSVTDRCNLRCIYCMPKDGILNKPHSEILSFEEIKRIVKAAAGLGIEKVRITGGEPLVRKDLHLLIEELKNIGSLKELGLTTNGINLSKHASSLKKAGLDRVNISLDSLIPERFERITRGGSLNSVLRAIETCLSIGYSTLKINTVLLKGFNTDEILNFAKMAKARPIDVRFIEYMPTDLNHPSHEDLFFSALEAKRICGDLGRLAPIHSERSSTAKVFRIDGFCGTVGFITPISESFCASCNKLRLTSDGRLRSCLHSSKAIDLKSALETGASEEDLARLVKEAVETKPESHNLLNAPLGRDSEIYSMCQIGG
ncbi:MAG: GTP 3',8-cyclase MoaA [Candidatus Omnitrophica bacterium]|nr:GTP 3',8-cyclase MoaA [Candidatus Omnitrophota bacterium]